MTGDFLIGSIVGILIYVTVETLFTLILKVSNRKRGEKNEKSNSNN